jgi:hypothetical protein
MEHSALVALAAFNSNLKRVRFHKLDARILSPETAPNVGGTLSTEAGVKLGKVLNSEEWASTISLKIVGYAKKNATDDAEQPTAVFSVEGIIKGVYDWGEIPTKEVLTDHNLAHALGRPLYVLLATECKAVAAKMGFHGIKAPSDLPRPNDNEELPLTKTSLAANKSASKSDTIKKSTTKRTTSPKTR